VPDVRIVEVILPNEIKLGHFISRMKRGLETNARRDFIPSFSTSSSFQASLLVILLVMVDMWGRRTRGGLVPHPCPSAGIRSCVLVF
jgi:hypothetical protein